jgi:uncharacterized protein (TIGR03437 family)
VLYVGAVGSFVGLDQVSLRLPHSLKGVNKEIELYLTAAGYPANTVTIFVK